jgi:hypothetical protein
MSLIFWKGTSRRRIRCVVFASLPSGRKENVTKPHHITCRSRSRGSASRESALSMTFMRGDDTGTEAFPECSSLQIQGLMSTTCACNHTCAKVIHKPAFMNLGASLRARANIVVLYDCWEMI